ncbi:DUF4304 domain-containing protein [Campylobacter concisus]|uniref:DUF4304 domain-containing protein n=1 Tax=Campylobacter concisus UNSW2 TaxID=1242965 RepID=U2GTL7_9BACT|nr:DUF4304 domain-containing protein [Campylobacter concisus]ERJ31399.1 hypothetical protein UNSW2_1171 [Campylobacter concisus UNSW2]
MKEKFDELIALLKPLFKDNGFSKSALNFYKNTPNFIYVVNFQKSSSNSLERMRFYINCGIYGSFIEATLGKEALSKPKEYECHFRARAHEITRTAAAYYELESDSDVAKIYKNLINDLGFVFKFFEQNSSEENLIELMLEENGLAAINQLYEYLLIKDKSEILISHAKRLFAKHGSEARWGKFQNQINELLRKYKKDEIKFKE